MSSRIHEILANQKAQEEAVQLARVEAAERKGRRAASERAATQEAAAMAFEAALKDLPQQLQRAMAQPLGDLAGSRAGARSFLHGNVAGTFHQILADASPRWDALNGIETAIRALTSTDTSGRALPYPRSAGALAELDRAEVSVYRAKLQVAQILAGEVDAPAPNTGWRK